MGIHLVTGHAGKPHVTSADQGAFNAGIIGGGKYVLNTGSRFLAETISNNLIRIHDGELIDQGRQINIPVNDYEDCIIDNGLQGVKRNDLIVARYHKNKETDIEEAELVVVKGVSGTQAVDPEITVGNILNGDVEDDVPLYRVRLDGINIIAVEPVFNVLATLDELNTNLSNVALNEGNFAICSQMSGKPVYEGTAYLGTSFYLPKAYALKVTSVTAVGASGNFVSSLEFDRYGDYVRPTTVNANLAGYMLQIEGTISK